MDQKTVTAKPNLAMRREFMKAFRGNTKGTLISDTRRRLQRAFAAIEKAGYAKN